VGATLGAVFGAANLGLHRGDVSAWAHVPLLLLLGVIAVLDLRLRLIPNVLSLPGVAYALSLAAVAGPGALAEAVLGLAVAGGLVLLVMIVSRGRGIGGGDLKLMALLGAALGWRAALIVLGLSQLVVAVPVLAVLLVRRRRPNAPVPVGAAIAVLGALALCLAR
jgi:leader peptidase (prepilin peptidase)/N-methyltransferase